MEFQTLTPAILTPALQEQIRELFKQLNSELRQLEATRVLAAANPPILLACLEGDQLIAMGTVCFYDVISGRKAWIEDVVVDEAARGQGLGRRIMEKLIEIAKEREAGEVLLFTGHHRTPAINLYKSMGFVEKQSKLLRLMLHQN